MVIVSCVTEKKPYRSHPHMLIGKNTCAHGIYTIETYSQNNIPIIFPDLVIQRVAKKEIVAALKLKEEIQNDPFNRKYLITNDI